ncbi:uncharacterized protein LOC143911076 isoform X2 [Arctopsyche grandis]|uniref:uncharacterized protein LOC143911076 isoform X2 n=1 Tax=Arctopsyche grandis TaxID=121162 RepID=UPI00406D6414
MENHSVTKNIVISKPMSPLKREALRDLINLNTSGEQSQNSKPNDKTQTVTVNQASANVKNSNNKISDGKRNPNQEIFVSPCPDSVKSACESSFKDIPQANLINSLIKINEEGPVNHPKQKVYNELTESFDTPNSSTLSVANISSVIQNTDSFEIGEDPLSLPDDVPLQFQIANKSSCNSSNSENSGKSTTSIDSLNKSANFDQTFSVDSIDNEPNDTSSLYSSHDRESSVEVIKEDSNSEDQLDLDATFKAGIDNSNNERNPNDSYCDNSFVNAFTKLSVSPTCYAAPKKSISNEALNFDNTQDTIENDLDSGFPDRCRRDSGASIFVISSVGIDSSNDITQNTKTEVVNEKEEADIKCDTLKTNINIEETTKQETSASNSATKNEIVNFENKCVSENLRKIVNEVNETPVQSSVVEILPESLLNSDNKVTINNSSSVTTTLNESQSYADQIVAINETSVQSTVVENLSESSLNPENVTINNPINVTTNLNESQSYADLIVP